MTYITNIEFKRLLLTLRKSIEYANTILRFDVFFFSVRITNSVLIWYRKIWASFHDNSIHHKNSCRKRDDKYKKANKRNTQRPFYHKDYVNRHIDI